MSDSNDQNANAGANGSGGNGTGGDAGQGGGGQSQNTGGDAGGNLDELPAWARESITKANREAAGYRTQLRELEPLAQKAREADEATKSEVQKAADRAAAAEKKAEEAEARALRLEVAASKGLNAKQAARLVGATREELEADADELLADFTPGGGGEAAPSRPTERLTGGGRPSTEGPIETDPAKLAAGVARF